MGGAACSRTSERLAYLGRAVLGGYVTRPSAILPEKSKETIIPFLVEQPAPS